MKTARLFTIGFALCSAAATSLFGQTTNFYCTNAVEMFSGTNYTANTSAAPANSGPTDGCGGSLSHGVWYTVTPAINQRVRISTAGSSFPTGLSVYTGACGALTNVQCSLPAYYGGNGLASVDFSSPSNVTYYILAGGVNGNSGNLVITATLTNPPANDLCTGAIDLSSIGSSTEPTTYATEPGDATDGCGGNLSHGVWYTVTPSINQRVKISTAGSSFPTGLSVYTGACGTLTSVQCSLPAYYGGNGLASVDFSSPSNVTYYILAGGVNGNSGNLVITATLTNPPANDLCTGAIDLSTIGSSTESTIYATEPGDATDGCGGNLSHGVWYTVTPAINQRVKISTAGSSFPTGLSVYTGACGTLTSVQCSLPAYYGGNGLASVDFSSPSNVTYYILAGGVNGNSGNLVITATLTNPPANDLCTGAIDLSTIGSSTESTIYATEPGDATDGCGGNLSHGVWYTVTPAINQRVKISTAGSSFPTGLSVYTGACGTLTSVQCSLPAYYSGNGLASVDFSSPSNVTYYILAGGVNGNSGNLVITATLTNPPANDLCTGAIDLSTIGSSTESTIYATEPGDATDGCGGNLSHGVWYTVTPAINQRVKISTAGSSFPTGLSVYTGACGALTNVQCSLPAYYGGNGLASVDFSSPSNVTYYILAGGVNGNSGNLVITATLTNPPANDLCTGAIDLSSIGSSTEPTTYATEPGDATDGCGGNLSHGVWYTVTPAINQRVKITTAGSSFPTGLSVYTGACGALTNVQCSLPAYYGGNGLASVDFSSPSNVTYYILVGGVNGNSGNLAITATLTNPPANDLCTGAIDLTTIGSSTEPTIYATEPGDATDGCGGNLSHGVWYTVTPAINQRVRISTAGSSFPTGLSVYTGACGALTNVQCSLPAYYAGNGLASVDFSSASNVTYYILAGGVNGNSGNLQISVTLTNPPANDLCTGAVSLTNGVTNVMDTTYATEIGDAASGCGAGIDHGVWFTLAAFTGQPITIGTCGSSYATDLVVYTNACGSLGTPFTCSSGSNPFNCAGNLAGVSFIAPTNTTYYILASGVGAASGTLRIVANLPPPANDMCSGAIAMTNGVIYSTNTTYATSIGDPVPSCVPTFGRGVWYSYTPSVSGPVGVTTCGSSFQTALAAYTGTCGSWTEVACSQNSGAYCNSGYNADINFNGLAGTNYYILAGGVNGAAGNLQILIPVVDLVSTSLTATNPAGGLLTAGRNFSASWSVQNQGANSIYGSWMDQLTLSNAATSVVVSHFSGPHNAPAGGGYSDGGTWNLGAIPAGSYTLIAQADAGNSVAEARKANNIQTLVVTVTNIAPAITLLTPTNQIVRVSCVAVPFKLLAQPYAGSYTITNVTFFDGEVSNVIGQATSAPYSTTSVALGIGTHILGALATDSFRLSGVSTNIATISVVYPTNLHVLRADIATNGDLVGCMCAYSGSNYVVESTTNVQAPSPWPPYVTNLASANVLAFTNHPTAPQRFFRARLSP